MSASREWRWWEVGNEAPKHSAAQGYSPKRLSYTTVLQGTPPPGFWKADALHKSTQCDLSVGPGWYGGSAELSGLGSTLDLLKLMIDEKHKQSVGIL